MPEGIIKLSQRDWIFYGLLALVVPNAMIVTTGGIWNVFFSVFTIRLTATPSILWPGYLNFTYILCSYMIAHVMSKPEEALIGSQIQLLTVLAFLWFIAGVVFIIAFVESPISYVPVPFVPIYGLAKYSLSMEDEEEVAPPPGLEPGSQE